MEHSSKNVDASYENSLTHLPVELQIRIYCGLPSLFDVMSLSTTCHVMRDVWTNNLNSIYRLAFRRSIPCERYARDLLFDQGGPAVGSKLCHQDVTKIMQNARVVERAVRYFERFVVRRVGGLFWV
jgi:hypothetical protein